MFDIYCLSFIVCLQIFESSNHQIIKSNSFTQGSQGGKDENSKMESKNSKE
jgi:hypothetical protein